MPHESDPQQRDSENRAWDGVDRVLVPIALLLMAAAIAALAWAAQQ